MRTGGAAALEPDRRPQAQAQAQSQALARALSGRLPSAGPQEPPGPPGPEPRPTERALRLGTFVAVALAAALISGQAWVTALAVPPLVLLVLAWPSRGGRIRGLEAAGEVSARRIFEGETVQARVRLSFRGRSGWIDPGVYPGPGVELTAVEVHRAGHEAEDGAKYEGEDGAEVRLEFTARRWGRWTLASVDVDVHDRGGLVRRTVRCDLGRIEVFPLAESASLAPVPVRLPEHIGEHVSLRPGEGREVVGVRAHVPGERQRRIHWPATTRRNGEIQLNQFAGEHAADVVLLVDAFADLDTPGGGSTLDDTLRVAAGIVRAYLPTHDRVGVVSVGGRLNWLPPGSGEQYFYRIVQSLLDVRRDLEYRAPDLQRLPAPALPLRALVYAVTPLADLRMFPVLDELAQRGNPLVVVEIPVAEPRVEPGRSAPRRLALRLRRVEAAALRWSMIEQGIRPVTWEGGDHALDLALGPLARTRLHGRRLR